MDDTLHVIMVLSNPCNYKRRIVLANEFIERMEKTKNVILYRVELVYGSLAFSITSADNPRHLQVRSEVPLWHKENMINLGVKKLLPSSWKYMAWIDADVEFLNTNWVLDALTLLREKDIIQLFDCIANLSPDRKVIYTAEIDSCPGYAWACTRCCYERLGGLYEYNIVGSGDTLLRSCLLNNVQHVLDSRMTNEYTDSIKKYAERLSGLRYGYIKGRILHYYHGSLKKRKFDTRKEILYNCLYKPSFFQYNRDGILEPSTVCPQGLLIKILIYFIERNDDMKFDPLNPLG